MLATVVERALNKDLTFPLGQFTTLLKNERLSTFINQSINKSSMSYKL